MTETKIIPMNGQNKGLVKQPVLEEINLKDLRDYKAEMEEANEKMKLLDKEQQREAKTKRGRNWRGGYLMAMVILNANNESIIQLQKERDDWFLAYQNRGDLLGNAQDMVDIQTGLSHKGMERENELKQEHQREIRKYQEVLTLLKRFPDTLYGMENNSPEEIIEALKAIEIKNRK